MGTMEAKPFQFLLLALFSSLPPRGWKHPHCSPGLFVVLLILISEMRQRFRSPALCRWFLPRSPPPPRPSVLSACTPFSVENIQVDLQSWKIKPGSDSWEPSLLQGLLVTLTLSSFLVHGPRGDLLVICSWTLYTYFELCCGGSKPPHSSLVEKWEPGSPSLSSRIQKEEPGS